MGLSPQDVLDLPLHDYEAAVHHFARSQGGPDEGEALSDDDFDEMMVGLAGFESRAAH